ncbi:hypothetical protein CEXT_801071 [Caerostris extrusa]|uniref:Uncharacterized protein n=1 Tax=Caerostris extrusa TaxID=172846 RepID=A0AAV4NET5_CAEEX|nr:hypothetical protein CEXT_801071 [Caerostris extrusa]
MFKGGGVLIWDVISINDLNDLYIIRNGCLSAQRRSLGSALTGFDLRIVWFQEEPLREASGFHHCLGFKKKI